MLWFLSIKVLFAINSTTSHHNIILIYWKIIEVLQLNPFVTRSIATLLYYLGKLRLDTFQIIQLVNDILAKCPVELYV